METQESFPLEPSITAEQEVALATAALARHTKLCEALCTGLDKALESKKEVPMGGAQARVLLADGSLVLLELKEVNRTVWEQTAALKARSAAANQEVDVADLKLQNLQYEKNYFLREIRLARDLPPEKPIDLLSREAFEAAAPPELKGRREQDDPHAYHLARLELELQQRSDLCERRDVLQQEKAALEASLAGRRAFLEGMQGELASITRIARPLQDLLRQRLTTRWIESRQLELLPPPLRRLFERAVAHRETARPDLVVTVVGDLELAAQIRTGDLELKAAFAPSAVAGVTGADAPQGPTGAVVGVGEGGANGGGAHGGAHGGAPNGMRRASTHAASPQLKRQRTVDAGGDEGGGGGGGGGGGRGASDGARHGAGASEGAEGAGADADAEADADAFDTDETTQLHPLRVRLHLPLPPPVTAPTTAPNTAPTTPRATTPRATSSAAVARVLQLEVCCVPSYGLLAVTVLRDPSAASSVSAQGFAQDGADAGETAESAQMSAAVLGANTLAFANLWGLADTGEVLPSFEPPTGGAAPPLTPSAAKDLLLMLRPAVPYEWIQELGRPAAAIPNGRPNGPSGGSSSGGAVSAHDASPDIFSSLAGALESRVFAADALALQLANLANLDPSLPPSLVVPLPSPPLPPLSRLVEWRSLEPEEVPLVGFPSLPAWRLHRSRLFYAQVRAHPPSLPLPPLSSPLQAALLILV